MYPGIWERLTFLFGVGLTLATQYPDITDLWQKIFGLSGFALMAATILWAVYYAVRGTRKVDSLFLYLLAGVLLIASVGCVVVGYLLSTREAWADVSIETSPVFGMSPTEQAVLTGPWHFTNVSPAQPHMLEVRIELLLENGRKIVLDTEDHKQTVYRDRIKERDKDNRLVRGRKFLEFPLKLEPSSFAEGYIDFPVRLSVDEFLISGGPTVTIFDKMSENEITLLLGEHYSAVSGKRFDPRHHEKKQTAIRPIVTREGSVESGTKPEHVTFDDLLPYEFPNTFIMSDPLHERGDYIEGIFATFYRVQDVNARAEYFVAHIPNQSTTHKISELIAKNYQAIQRRTGASKSYRSQDQFVGNENLPVTGQIYIYHEATLTESQRNELKALFKANGLNVVFRGPKYLAEKRAWLGPRLHK